MEVVTNHQSDSWPDFLPPSQGGSSGQSYNPHYDEEVQRSNYHNQRDRQETNERFWRQASSNVPTQSRPVVTTAIISICFVVWLLQLVVPSFTGDIALNRALSAGQPWRLLTSAFAHGGLAHIACNMLTLWVMGKNLEPLLGRAKFLALYLVSALGGSVCFLLLASPMSFAVGASGAIFGLFGTYAVIYRAMKLPMTSIWTLLGVNLVITLLSPGIAWQAHLGGLICGALASALIFYEMKFGKKTAWPGIIVLVIALAALSYVTLRIGF